MNNELLMEKLEESEATLFINPSYDSALVGITTDGKAVYEYSKMVEFLCTEDNMTIEDAEDFISYNTIRSLPYMPNPPVIIDTYLFDS